ncbi:MAG: hypothetical protein VW842_06815, partial [Halieaceae bacterium]
MMAGILMSLALPDPDWGLMVAVLLPALWIWRHAAMTWALLGLIMGSVNGILWLDTRLPER